MLPLLSLLALTALVTSPSALASSPPHNVESLFRRATPVPAVGSAEWVALYPAAGSTPTHVPQAWTDALAAAVASGKIPNFPPATLIQGVPQTYSNGLDPTGPVACHNTLGCSIPSDKLTAPDGMIGISQDDGPLPPGRTLNSFFEAQKISATHFYIGGNVIGNSDIFLQARDIPGQHFAVHTWTHPYMSSLSNEAVVAELGWTMQILADSNYGKIPAHWRPPFGDVDNRVRAIAKEVFGLQTVVWGPDRDTEDWTLTNLDKEDVIKATITGFLQGPKAPGMLMLQHELSDRAVNAFITLWPSYLSNGWDCRNIPDLWGESWYKNSFSASTPNVDGVTIVSIGGANTTEPDSSSSSSPSSSSSTPSSSAAAGSSTSVAPSSSAVGSMTRSASVSRSAASLGASASASASSTTAASSGERSFGASLGGLGGGLVVVAWLLI